MNCHSATSCSFVNAAFSPLKRKVSICVLLDEEKAFVMKSIMFLKNFSLSSLRHFFYDFFLAITAPPPATAAKAEADTPNRPLFDAAITTICKRFYKHWPQVKSMGKLHAV